MRLDPLFSFTLAPAVPAATAAPYGTAESSEFEYGSGQVTGRLTGTLSYSQRLRRRSDGLAFVDVHGLIAAAEGNVVVTGDGREDAGGDSVLLLRFEAQAPVLRWLNELICNGEGTFDPVNGWTTVEVFAVTPSPHA
jgi:hypothetical protein